MYDKPFGLRNALACGLLSTLTGSPPTSTKTSMLFRVSHLTVQNVRRHIALLDAPLLSTSTGDALCFCTVSVLFFVSVERKAPCTKILVAY